MLQHYLAALHRPAVGMIDMAKLVQQCYSPLDLERYLFHNEYGRSDLRAVKTAFESMDLALLPGLQFIGTSAMRLPRVVLTASPEVSVPWCSSQRSVDSALSRCFT